MAMRSGMMERLPPPCSNVPTQNKLLVYIFIINFLTLLIIISVQGRE